MTNPYLAGSDFDSMAGPRNPTKTRMLQQGRAAISRAIGAGVRPMGGGPVLHRPQFAQPYQDQDGAEAFEAARGDEALFGMDSGPTLIGAGLGGTVFTAPQKPVIPTRMVLSDAMSNNFTMSSLTVGVEPIFLTNGVNISLAAFTPQSTASEFRSVLCHVGNTISAVITNISGAPQRFIASIYGVPWLYGPAY